MKKPIVIYDINAVNQDGGLTVQKIADIFKESGWLFYDSTLGEKPQVIDVEDLEVVYVDVSEEEGLKKWNGYKKRIK